jgi:hypothetical protein
MPQLPGAHSRATRAALLSMPTITVLVAVGMTQLMAKAVVGDDGRVVVSVKPQILWNYSR